MATRPEGIPHDAWWSAKDNEWILGAKDDQDRLVGEVTYWRPDGSLVCTCEHLEGKPHGVARRFHETGEIAQHCHYERGQLHGLRAWWMTDGVTTEKPRAQGLADSIWRGELDYVHDRVVGFRYYDRADHEVDSKGVRLATRPARVPVNALRNKAGLWTAGEWDEAGKQVGVQRFWSAEGVLLSQENHLLDGTLRATHYRSDGTRKLEFEQRDKQLVGAANAWRRDGTQSVRASFAETSTVIEHLDEAGAVVRRATYATSGTPAVVEMPTGPDDGLLAQLADFDLAVDDVTVPLTPPTLARAIAIGWGGDDDRVPLTARLMRRLVLNVATPSLRELLVELDLDRMPRLRTARRVDTVIRALAEDPSVNLVVLRDELIAQGGPAVVLALADPDRARAFLAAAVHEETLNLGNLGLTELPRELGAFPAVAKLDAEANRLTTLPDEVGDMFKLSTLNLTKNRITSLPRTLGWLPALRTLHLSHNDLVAIPPAVWELAELRSLGLGDNRIVEVPDAIGEMRSLAEIWLNDNPLRTLPSGLAKCPLTFLHLGNHPWAEPPDLLGELVELETLWIASPALKRLPAAICRLPKLQELMLWYSAVTEVPDELYEMKQLKELRIKHNPLPDAVYAKLAEALPDTKIY